jgi:hypothetical protein
MRACAWLLAGAMCAAGESHAEVPELASKLDYTLNESRDKPIRCKAGDIESFPGQSLAQVFGDAWPLQPEPMPESERARAQALKSVRPRAALRGLPVQPGLVVVAVLVDASGDPLRAEVLCATTAGYDKAVKRMAMQSDYAPAVINGKAVTSVAVHVQTFAGGRS